MASDQQFCLKWNNHRSTLFSVFDSLLEEESLVDVTLSAEGQFIRAHRVILSACSPYFKTLFRASYLLDKHPVIFMKDVDFDNLKALVEYMYKGEANVPQHMLQSFIRTAESLQIRGLAECATKQLEAEQNLPSAPTPPQPLISQTPPNLPNSVTPLNSLAASLPHHSTPNYKGDTNRKRAGAANGQPGASSGGGILAKHLAKMMDGSVGPQLHTLPPPQFDFHPESLLPRHPNHLPPPPMKKPRKSEPRPSGSAGNNHLNSNPTPPPCLKDLPPFLAMNHDDRLMLMKASYPAGFSPPKTVTPRMSNNNNYDHEEGALKIDEDIDPGKENRMDSPISNDDDIAELDVSNAGSSDEEEEAMPGPGVELADPPRIINPWTGEVIKLPEDHDDSSIHDGDSHLYQSMLECSMISRSDTSGESGCRGNGSMSLDQANDPNVQKYACARCGRSYLHQATLVRHQRYECGISASYPCSLCGRKFKRRDVLKGHMEKCVNKSTVAAATAAMAMGAGPGGSNGNSGANNGGILPLPVSLQSPMSSSMTGSIGSSMANSMAASMASSLAASMASSMPSSMASTLAASMASSMPTSMASSLAASMASSMPSSMASSMPSSMANSLSNSMAASMSNSMAASMVASLAAGSINVSCYPPPPSVTPPQI